MTYLRGVVLMVLATIPVAAQNVGAGPTGSKSSPPPRVTIANQPETGRFHLLAVKTPGRSTAGSIEVYDEVFLYDTATGRVWMYEPSSPILDNDVGKEILIPAYFDELTVDNLHGSHDAEVDRSFKVYFRAFEAKAKAYCKNNPTGAYHAKPQEPGPGTDCSDFLSKHPDTGQN